MKVVRPKGIKNHNNKWDTSTKGGKIEKLTQYPSGKWYSESEINDHLKKVEKYDKQLSKLMERLNQVAVDDPQRLLLSKMYLLKVRVKNNTRIR